MRIIRLVVILLVIVVAMLPYITLADETPNTEIKTNINLNTFANLFLPENAQAAQNKEERVEAVLIQVPKTEEELKNEKILSVWKEKQSKKWENLPTEAFEINASAYTAAADECDKADGVTASGVNAQEDRTLACPSAFPFGAKIEIEGMGTYVCEDRGGAIKGNHFDIFMQTKKDAFAFGRQHLMAKIVF